MKKDQVNLDDEGKPIDSPILHASDVMNFHNISSFPA